MKKQFLNYILLVLLFATCSVKNATAQNIHAEAKLQDFTIKIGEQTRFFLVVDQPAKEHVNFPRLVDTIIGKVQIVSINKADTVIDQNDKSKITVTQGYVITSFDSGMYNIPALSFGTSSEVVKSNEVTLQVQTVKVDTTKAIYDIKQPIAVSYTFIDWIRDHLLWIIGGWIIAGLVVGVIYYLRNKPKNEPVIKVVKPSVPIHITALTQLNELRDKKLWQQEQIKEYHTELTDILRDYLEKRYNIQAQEQTTDEIVAALKHRDLANEYRDSLQQLLVLADLTKFAKEKPLPIENEQSMDKAIYFILKTKEEKAPENNTEGGSANEPV
ncbi:MAG: hypothetical protein V4560_03130 [Bacteroidota bacterium]